MRKIPELSCRVHVLVCANARPPGGLPWCGKAGEALFDVLKQEVLGRGLARQVWVTRTHCLGFCHKDGATLAIYRPGSNRPPVFYQAAQAADLGKILDEVTGEL